MKKFLFFVFCTFILWSANATAQLFGGGRGFINDPYIRSDTNQLHELADSVLSPSFSTLNVYFD